MIGEIIFCCEKMLSYKTYPKFNIVKSAQRGFNLKIAAPHVTRKLQYFFFK